MFTKSFRLPSKSDALPGRPEHMAVSDTHFVNGHRLFLKSHQLDKLISFHLCNYTFIIGPFCIFSEGTDLIFNQSFS